ncbi:MAG: hypothetical protein ACREH4_10075, partial [Vitreimonas sp.]
MMGRFAVLAALIAVAGCANVEPAGRNAQRDLGPPPVDASADLPQPPETQTAQAQPPPQTMNTP